MNRMNRMSAQFQALAFALLLTCGAVAAASGTGGRFRLPVDKRCRKNHINRYSDGVWIVDVDVSDSRDNGMFI